MPLPFHLDLRYNKHLLSLIKLGDRPREVLGMAYPEDSDRRARIPTHWGQSTQSPRHIEQATIDLPLPVRAQTILSYQVNAQARAEINGGITPLTQSRRDEQPGPKQRLHLGTEHAGLPVEARARLSSTSPTIPSTPSVRLRHSHD